MGVMKLIATIKREKNVFLAEQIKEIKDSLLKRLKGSDPEFKEKTETQKNELSKYKLKILDTDALAICKEADIPKKDHNAYKKWILSLIGIEGSGVGFNVSDGKLEDRTGLIENLRKYYLLKLQQTEGVPKNIFDFKSVGGLIEAVKDHEVSDSEKIKKEKWKAFFKEGKDLLGATVLFKNGSYSVYHVEGTHLDTINALVKMSAKDPDDVKNYGTNATRLSTCSWCTADPMTAENYLREHISLTMFYKDGEPKYELLGARKNSNRWDDQSGEFHNASNNKIPLTKLAELIRNMEMPKENREKIWKALVINPKIGNDIIDNPDKHATKAKELASS